MFWPVMFEATSNVGPERAPKKMPILILEIPICGAPGSTHSKHSRQQAQQTAERRPQQHELGVHAAVADCGWTSGGTAAALQRCHKSTYIFLQYFFVMYIDPKKSCTSKGVVTEKKNAHPH